MKVMNDCFKSIKDAARQAQQTLKNWGVNVEVGCEVDGDNIFAVVLDRQGGFRSTFATVSQEGKMTIDLTPRTHTSFSVDSLSHKTLGLMFALSALSNLISHREGWLQLDDNTYLSLAWDYYKDDGLFDVEVMAAKFPPTTPSEPMEMEIKVSFDGKKATLDGAVYGAGDIDVVMRLLVRLVLAFIEESRVGGYCVCTKSVL